MKSYKKYLLTLIFIFGILLLFSNTNVVKAEDVEQEIIISYDEEIDVEKLEDIKTTRFKALLQPRTTVKASPTQEDISKYYYNQLKHDVSRNTYNTLTNQLLNNVTIDLNDCEYTVEASTDEALIECFQENLQQYVLDGYEAYVMDGTKYYWWTPGELKFGEIRATLSNKKLTFKTVQIQSTMEEWNDYTNFITKFKTVCNSIKGDSVYEIAEAVNNYICSNVEYAEIDDTSAEQTAYGALIMNKAVCEGQAHLFNLICREKGISCINVYGYISENNASTAHAWNYIYEPSKEQWYAVDVTWNNTYNNPLYFMVGSDTEIQGIKFRKNHIAGFKQFAKQTYTPSTPILSAEKYERDDNTDNTAPTITVSPTSATTCKSAKVTITVADNDGGSGLSTSNSYQYYLSTSSTTLSGGTWRNYTSGVAFTIGSGITGTRYLFIKRVNDKVGNTSTSNGTATTISGTTYHRFGSYVFDNTVLTIESTVYKIENDTIGQVQPKTTIKELKTKITTNATTITVIDKDGKNVSEETLVGTGMKITFNGKNTYTLVVLGDTNGDGKASIQDIMQINKHRLNKTQLTDCYLKAGDVNNDGKVNIQDIMQINKYRLGKINEF